MSGHSSSSKAGPSYFGGDDDDEDEEDDGGMLMDDDDEDEDLLDEDMLENGGGEGTRAQKITTAGEAIASSSTFMRGHGSYLAAPSTTEAGPANIIYSSLPGLVLRTNKLVSVRPLRSRYTPEVGDLVVGRITEVQPGGKRWKVDINARQDATLALSSINLPGGVQRKKLESDELQMRTFFKEGDLLVAEAQSVFNDGSVGLHTRSLRYGKLRNGELAHVQPVLIQRLKSHFVHLERANIDLTVGMNGYIWCSKHIVFDVDLAEQEGEGQMGAKAAAEGLAMAPRFEGKGIGGSGVGMDVDAGAGVYGDQNEVSECPCERVLITTDEIFWYSGHHARNAQSKLPNPLNPAPSLGTTHGNLRQQHQQSV